jgi:hypothetical protein
MTRYKPGRGMLRSLAVVMAAGVAMLWAPMGGAQTSAYSGSANTDLVHVQALNIPGTFQLAEAAVAPSLAEMNSAGVEGGGNSHSRAANLDVDLLSGAIPLTGLLVEADHRAPGSEPGPVEETLLEVPADPLLNARVAHAMAHSRWVAGGCVPVGTPIATSKSEVADVNVLTGTPAGDALLALDNAQGGTVFSNTRTEHVAVPGQTGLGVKSTANTQLTAIRLFKGTPNELTINVLAPPVVEAVATGKPGGAKVTYSEPILQVVDANGDILGELNAASADFELDLSPLAILRLGRLTKSEKSDGTEAKGRAVLLEVILLNAPGQIEPGARLTVAGGDVSAKVPSGGVNCAGGPTTGGGGDDGGGDDCNLSDVTITPSKPTVQAGSTFTYTITVTNGDCPLDEVPVDLKIDGPPGSEVVSTDPEADSVDGLNVKWDNVGPLDAGESKQLKVTVQVPSDADDGAEYSGDVTADDESAHVDGPSVGSETAVGGVSLPRTGAELLRYIAAAFLLFALGWMMRLAAKGRSSAGEA